MTTSMISAEHLTYKRNRHLILDDLNLNVHQGHFIGLLGANGAGKTTLMRLLNGLATNFYRHHSNRRLRKHCRSQTTQQFQRITQRCQRQSHPSANRHRLCHDVPRLFRKGVR